MRARSLEQAQHLGTVFYSRSFPLARWARIRDLKIRIRIRVRVFLKTDPDLQLLPEPSILNRRSRIFRKQVRVRYCSQISGLVTLAGSKKVRIRFCSSFSKSGSGSATLIFAGPVLGSSLSPVAKNWFRFNLINDKNELRKLSEFLRCMLSAGRRQTR